MFSRAAGDAPERRSSGGASETGLLAPVEAPAAGLCRDRPNRLGSDECDSEWRQGERQPGGGGTSAAAEKQTAAGHRDWSGRGPAAGDRQPAAGKSRRTPATRSVAR